MISLKEKLRFFKSQAQILAEMAAQNNNSLPRSEWWKKEYYDYPYLASSTREQLVERLHDVFLNNSELDYQGRIIPVISSDNDYLFTRLFSHLLAENDFNRLLTTETFSNIRAPFAKYFVHENPVGMEAFQRLENPAGKLLIKYSKRQYLEPLLRDGNVRFMPASYYSSANHNAAIRDSEIDRQFIIPAYDDYLTGKTYLETDGRKIDISKGHVEYNVRMDDYYLLCLSTSFSLRLPTDFEADAMLWIKNPERFLRAINSGLRNKLKGTVLHVGQVEYFDPYLKRADFEALHFKKHLRYTYQKEFRFTISGPDLIVEPNNALYIQIGDMRDYAEIIDFD